MANSINVTQNKWARITQLKGRSSCLCRSRYCCSLPRALPALSLVRGPSRWQISVWLPLRRALVLAGVAQNRCSTAKGRWKQTGSFVWLKWSTLLCPLCPCSLHLQASVLLTLNVTPRTTQCHCWGSFGTGYSLLPWVFSLLTAPGRGSGWVLLMAASSWVL